MSTPPEQVAEGLANKIYGEDKKGEPEWMVVKSAFILGYVECLNNWKWENNDAASSESRRDDRKVISLESARSRHRR